VTQYDVEYFQKLEKLIGKKMNECKVVKEHVMSLTDTVLESLKIAKNVKFI
jgi:hypothetical protein